ncbi:hypothetical protein ANCDUO_21331, partial [Ancylostoma duodenale]
MKPLILFKQKTVENTIALKQLPLVLKSIDKVTASDSERLFRVSKGLLAGNVFDWGAQKVYKPDVADLNLDSEAREFWLKTFEKSVDSVIKKAVESQANCSSAEQRVQVFREKFLKQLMVIREKP